MRATIYILLAFSLLSLSCEDDDSLEDTQSIDPLPEETITPSYFSLVTSDLWEYDVTADEIENTSETLEVSGSTTVNGSEFTNFETSTESISFMNNLFSVGALAEIDGRLLYTGSINIPLDADNQITVDVPPFTLYNSSLEINGSNIDQTTQTITQEVENIPLTITTTVTSISGGILDNVTINSYNFSSVLVSNLNINVLVTAEVFGIPITILPSQDVFVVTNTYALNVGLVNSEVDFQYELSDLSQTGIEIPFPQSAQNSSSQTIASFEVAGDD